MILTPCAWSEEVERSIKKVKDKTGDRWTVPFVLARIQAGMAGLFELRDKKHIAYIVLEKYEQGEAPWMNVWILEGAGLEYAQEVLPLLDQKCKEIGCVAWRCTGRKGWAKFLKPVATVYEREVL